MRGKSKKSGREKDLTARYKSGHLDEDGLAAGVRFGDKSKHFQRRKTERTALLRAAEDTATAVNIEALPSGEVIQVYSLYCDVDCGGVIWLCVVRKTLAKVAETGLVVGDIVRFRETGNTDDQGRPEAVIEWVAPRRTLLTRADSFKAQESQPIVANAQQMLLVAALSEPWPKWGLIDRMLVAAQAGGLVPIICLNKADLKETKDGLREWDFAMAALEHYRTLGIIALLTSVTANQGIDELRAVLTGKVTVLAGHSGVGKSSLIAAVQPGLDLRIGEISGYTGKGRHTTTSAKRYPVAGGGFVVDTPGVKLFGLWNLTRENLPQFFPDVEAGAAPDWRQESFQRILESLPG